MTVCTEHYNYRVPTNSTPSGYSKYILVKATQTIKVSK